MKALITGASSGIGKEMAIYLSSLGWDLVLVSRNKEKLEELSSRLKTKVLYSKFKEILKKNPNFIIYGEWLVPVTIKRYGKEKFWLYP